jgi:co-chaperonin GroES (HSP10)
LRIKPLNRHLVVHKKPREDKQKSSSFILPEGYESSTEQYSIVKVLEISEDSKLKNVIKPGSEVIVESNMLFEVTGSTLILDNYVYGLIDS